MNDQTNVGTGVAQTPAQLMGTRRARKSSVIAHEPTFTDVFNVCGQQKLLVCVRTEPATCTLADCDLTTDVVRLVLWTYAAARPHTVSGFDEMTSKLKDLQRVWTNSHVTGQGKRITQARRGAKCDAFVSSVESEPRTRNGDSVTHKRIKLLDEASDLLMHSCVPQGTVYCLPG